MGAAGMALERGEAMRVGFLHSLMRKDEKLLLDELRSRDYQFVTISRMFSR